MLCTRALTCFTSRRSLSLQSPKLRDGGNYLPCQVSVGVCALPMVPLHAMQSPLFLTFPIKLQAIGPKIVCFHYDATTSLHGQSLINMKTKKSQPSSPEKPTALTAVRQTRPDVMCVRDPTESWIKFIETREHHLGSLMTLPFP